MHPVGIDIIRKYFEGLDNSQYEKYNRLPSLYKHWNDHINIVSRKDIDHLAKRHILHSLAIGKFVEFRPNTAVLDIGTGGGFPGIPLAILFPETKFHLIDSIGKKIKVVEAVSSELGLANVSAQQIRAELVPEKYDFVLSRAVTRLKPFLQWIGNNFKPESTNAIRNGLIALKGGDLSRELSEIKRPYELINISDYFVEEFFETKKIVHVPMVK